MTGQRFLESLSSTSYPVVMEIKKRNGNGEDLVGGHSLGQLVNRYEEAEAPCLSVVTSPVFGGTPRLLQDVRQLTSLPILVKDFIVSEDQITEVSHHGADAVLLTASLLPAQVLKRLIIATLLRGLTPFVEVVTSRQLERVWHAEHCVVAVSNRDIAARERDGPPGVTRSLDLITDVLRTGTNWAVSASGIETPQIAAELLTTGYHGLLVGCAILRAPSPKQWIAQMAALASGKARG